MCIVQARLVAHGGFAPPLVNNMPMYHLIIGPPEVRQARMNLIDAVTFDVFMARAKDYAESCSLPTWVNL